MQRALKILGLVGFCLGVVSSVVWVHLSNQSNFEKLNLQDELSAKLLKTTEDRLASTFESSILSESDVVGLVTELVSPLTQTIINQTTNIASSSTSLIQSNIALDSVDKIKLMYVKEDKTLGTISEGSSGQYLKSNGSGHLPSWVSISLESSDFTDLTAESGTFESLTLAGSSLPLTVGSGNEFQVDDNGRLQLAYVGDSGYLSSSGGAIFINNTQNIGTGLGIYSNAGADAMGNMINVKVDNPLYNQAAFYMNYDGLSNAVEIVSNSNDSSSNALSVTGNNINDSTVGIIGYELGKGTLKITHNRPGTGNDQNASGLSIDLKGSGTRAQGLYVDSTETGGTLGNLLRLRNESNDKFVVNYQGNLTMTGSQTVGANGTDTTLTKYGNTAGDEFFVGTNASFRIQRSASNSEAFRTQVAGDANGRWVGTSDGRLRWGNGTNATDVTLRRTATGILSLEGGIILNSNSGDYDTLIRGVGDSSLFVVDASANAIGIGTSSPQAPLHVSKNGAGNAAVIVNQLGSADIFSASSSGTTKFKVLNTGDLATAVGTGWRPLSDAVLGLQVQSSDGTGFVTFDTSNRRVGIGTASPGAPLHVVGGDIWLENNQALRIKDSGGSARSVLAYTSGNNVQLYNYASSGILQIGINNASNTGNIRFFTNNNVERMRIDPSGVAIGATSFGTNAANVLALASSTAPTTSIVDGVQLFAVDSGGNHELQVRDEQGNVTTLSPHNFSLIPEGKSEDLAWAFYSERGNLAINADMTKALRLVEQMSGEQLLFVKDKKTDHYLTLPDSSRLMTANSPWAQAIKKSAVESVVAADSAPESNSTLEKLTKLASWDEEVWSFLGDVVFKAQAIFKQSVTFMAGVFIDGPIKVGSETAGTARIPQGATAVKISFGNEFSELPLVYVSNIQSIEGSYRVEAVTTRDFVITLDQAQAQELHINWLAILGEKSKGEGVEVLTKQEVGSPSISPSPAATPSSTDDMVVSEPTPSPSPDLEIIEKPTVAGASTSAETSSEVTKTPE